MGQDKSQLAWHGIRHDVYLARMCQSMGLTAYISKAHAYVDDHILQIPVLRDHYPNLGPMAAVATAFLTAPQACWLIWACDTPFTNQAAIVQLISQRDPSKYATAFQAEPNQPEPLMALYEPRMAKPIQDTLFTGTRSLQKLLKRLPIHLVSIDDRHVLTNVNTPAQKDEAQQRLT